MSGSTLRLVLTALLYTSLQINCRTMYVPGSKTAEACSHRLRQKRYAFYSYEHIWPSEFMPLTFGIKTDKMPAPHTGINVQKLERYTAECAKMWSEHSGFTYTMGETDKDIKADIIVEFAKLNSTGLARIDHTRDYERYGIIKLNSDLSKWISTDDSSLQWMICHEMGHTLGLEHSTVPEAVMYEVDIVNRRTWNKKLDQDDIDGISFLYPKGRPSSYFSIAARPRRIGSRQHQSTQSPRPASNWPILNSQQPMAWQPNLRSPTTYRPTTKYPPQNDVRQSTRAPRYAPPGHIPNYRPRSRPRSRW